MATRQPITLGGEDPKPTKGLTPQQRTMVGVGALVLCLLVGGGIVYWFLFGTTPKQRTVTVDPAQQTPGMGSGPMVRTPPRRPQMIVREDDKSWIARGTSGG